MTPVPTLHPNWLRPPEIMTEGYSLEITAKDVPALGKCAAMIPMSTPIAITFLPGEHVDDRIKATIAVRSLGFEPMPHFSARRLRSLDEFRHYLHRVVNDAAIKRCFVIAGDPTEAAGPFADSSTLIASGEFERAGIAAIGIGGHPEGHPNMTAEMRWDVLQKKCRDIENRGMASLIVTQFSFDPHTVLGWLAELRQRGIHSPVRIGVPGPAGIATLIRFAARCGVAATSTVMNKYGVSLTKLMGTAGPDSLVDTLAANLQSKHGPVRIHLYPFGGLERTVKWVEEYSSTHRAANKW